MVMMFSISLIQSETFNLLQFNMPITLLKQYRSLSQLYFLNKALLYNNDNIDVIIESSKMSLFYLQYCSYKFFIGYNNNPNITIRIDGTSVIAIAGCNCKYYSYGIHVKWIYIALYFNQDFFEVSLRIIMYV